MIAKVVAAGTTVRFNSRLADTPLLRIGHLAVKSPAKTTKKCMEITPAIADSRYYGHPAIMDIPLLRTRRYYGHPAIKDTPLLRTPRY